MQATLTVWRDKSERSVPHQDRRAPEEPAVAMRDAKKDSEETGKLGLAVRPLTGRARGTAHGGPPGGRGADRPPQSRASSAGT
jgi:hypothetical protein